MSTKAAVQAEARRQGRLTHMWKRRNAQAQRDLHVARSLLVDVLASADDPSLATRVHKDVRDYLLRGQDQPSALDIGIKEHRMRLMERAIGEWTL